MKFTQDDFKKVLLGACGGALGAIAFHFIIKPALMADPEVKVLFPQEPSLPPSLYDLKNESFKI